MIAEDTELRINQLEKELEVLKAAVKKDEVENTLSLVCFSGEWDRLFAAFTLANGGLALGMDVHMFFTFWAASSMRNGDSSRGGDKSFLQRMMARALPGSIAESPLSKMNLFGLGKVMMGRLMRKKGIPSLPDLVEDARELGAQFHFCDTSLQLFGFSCEELIDEDPSKWCGVSTFLSQATRSKMVVMI